MYVQNLVLILLIISVNSSSQSDPCNEYTATLKEEQRSVFNVFNISTSNALKDDRLTKQWHKIEISVGDRMPTDPPGTFRCGTWYPIWLDGSLPSQPGEQVTQRVCIQTFTGVCDRSWNIQIRYCCNDYFVYELEPSQITDSAYCFGDNSTSTSTSGYFPECFSTSTGFTSTLTSSPSTISSTTSSASTSSTSTSSPSTISTTAISTSFSSPSTSATSTSSPSTSYTSNSSPSISSTSTSFPSTNSPSTSSPSTSTSTTFSISTSTSSTSAMSTSFSSPVTSSTSTSSEENEYGSGRCPNCWELHNCPPCRCGECVDLNR